MSNLQTQWSEAELLATETVVEPLVVRGVRCHGGFDENGNYVSPRTKYRVPATSAWQQAHREVFGTEIIDAPLATWPVSYPDVAQAKYLLSEGVRGPIITTLTRIGTVEGFGAMIRGLGPGDLQRFFVESIDGTCLSHLQRGLFEAQARDEAGWEDEAGHRDMWFAALHTFAWAEEVLSDTDLVAGDGEAARIVSYVRADETPHVEYLKAALTEMRDRTFIGRSGRKYPGVDVISQFWDAALNESRDVRRPALLRATLAEVEHAVAGNRRRDEILEGFHACGTLAPDARGVLVPQ